MRELLKQALDALERFAYHGRSIGWDKVAMDLHEALAAPMLEPVAYLVEGWHDGKLIAHIPHVTLEDAKTSAAVFAQHYTTTKTIPLYATPQAAPAPIWEQLRQMGEDHAAAPAPVVPEMETRADGKVVRVDRWEWGIRRIVALLWGNRKEFEVDEVVQAIKELVPYPHEDDESLCNAVEHLSAAPVVREQLTNGEIYTAYIAATNQTLRPQDERLALAFARAIEKAHGITGGGK